MAGSLPLWNAHEAFGHPQFANGQTQTLNPLHAVVLINPDSPLLWDLHFLLLRFFAALFSCYLLKELGVRPALCLVGGVFAAIHSNFMIFLNRADLEAWAWMPAVLFAVARLRNRPGVPTAIAAAVAVAFCLMSGHPEPAFATLLGVSGFAIGLLAWQERRLRYLLALSAAALTAVLISAVYWVPFLALVARSHNAHPPGTGEGHRPLFEALQWLAPGAFNLHRLFGLFDTPHQNFGFLGGAMGTLAILGLASVSILPSQRRRLLWLGAPLFLSMKIYGVPGSGWLGRLPLVNRMPAAVYLQFPALYLLGIGGIVALSGLMESPRSRRNLVLLSTVTMVLLVVGLAPAFTDAGALSPFWPRVAAVTIAFALGAAVLIWRLTTSRGGRVAPAILLVMLVGGELGAYRTALSPRGNPAEEGPYVTWLKERQRHEAPFRVMGLQHRLMPNYATIYGLDDVRVCDALISPDYVNFVRRFVQRELDWTWFLSAEAQLGFDFENPILDWINVRYLIGHTATLAPRPSALQTRLLASGHPAWYAQAYEIDGRSLPVVYQHPNDVGFAPIDVPSEYPVLAFSLAQDPVIWDAPGDGATYSIAINAPREPETKVFSLEIDPKRRREDRRWIGGRADLSRWAGRTIQLSLEANSSNTASDWGGWGDLHWENAAGRRQPDRNNDRPPKLRFAYRDVERPDTVVFENPSVWPRIFAVTEPYMERSADAVLDRMHSLKESLGPLAVVGDDFPRGTWDALCQRTPCRSRPTPATIRDVRYGPRDLSLTMTTEYPVVLTVSDSFFPGWHARIDGETTPIFRSNYLFRGVIVPPGSHRVEMSYWPREWTLAMILEVVGMLGLAFAAAVAFRARRVGMEDGVDTPT